MLKFIRPLLLIMLVTAALANAELKSIDQSTAEIRADDRIALTEIRHQLNLTGALIRSREDLKRHVLEFGPGLSPLDQLSEPARAEFLATIEFGPAGAASLNTAPLERELTPTQSYAILELFGWQELAPNLRHKNVNNEVDMQLNSYCQTEGIGGGECDKPYIQGVCHSTATCEESQFQVWCYPPNCP